jgi:hypothetical protein
MVLKKQDITETADNTNEHFSAAVAAFGQQLRDGTYFDSFSLTRLL